MDTTDTPADTERERDTTPPGDDDRNPLHRSPAGPPEPVAASPSAAAVVETRCYLTEMSRWDEFNEIYGEYFSAPMPIRTTTSCGLVPPFLVEVAAVAWVG